MLDSCTPTRLEALHRRIESWGLAQRTGDERERQRGMVAPQGHDGGAVAGARDDMPYTPPMSGSLGGVMTRRARSIAVLAPVMASVLLNGDDRRAEVHGLGLIASRPDSAPYEDLERGKQ